MKNYRFGALLTIVSLAAYSTGLLATSDERVRASLGQPIVKSIKDAHYLLEEVRERARGLNVTRPSTLDPNEINVAQLDLLQTLVSINATFSELAGTQNEFLFEDRTLFIEQQRALMDQRAALWQEQLEVAEQKAFKSAEVEQRRALLPDDEEVVSSDPELVALQAELAQINAREAVINTQLGQVQTALAGLGTRPGTPAEFQSPPTITSGTPSTASPKLDSETTKKLIDQVADSDATPHYSAVLNRYIEAEYELVAKHLSLLRSQLSPDEELVFFELPLSITDVAQKKGKDYLVRTEWRVSTIWIDCWNAAKLKKQRKDFYFERNDQKVETNDSSSTSDATQANANSRRLQATFNSKDASSDRVEDCEPKIDVNKPTEFRILEVVPSQNALSVQDTVGKVSGLNLGAALSWLTGIGVSAAVDRQRQQFRKSIAQEVFAAGFGKGEFRFGWTFFPIPGASRLDPGTKTTFAIGVVPRFTRELEMSAHWCAFHKKAISPRRPDNGQPISGRRFYCESVDNWKVPVIGANESFWVDEILFSSVEAGEQVSVFVYGDAFPDNIRVLVNNEPLKQVVSTDALVGGSITQSTAGQPLPTGTPLWRGLFQRRSREMLHLVFSMDRDYFGTPLITLTTPSRTLVVNFTPNLKVNTDTRTSLSKYGERHPMIRRALSMENVSSSVVYDAAGKPTSVAIAVEGSGFTGDVRFFLSGKELTNKIYRSEAAAEFLVSPSSFRTKSARLVAQATRTQNANHIFGESVVNPLYPELTAISLIAFDEATGDALMRIGIDGDPRSLEFFDINANAEPVIHDLTDGGVLLQLLDQKKDVIVVGVRSKALGDTIAHVVTDIPKTPSIRLIENPAAGNLPKGLSSGGYQVVISGANLHHVGAAFFGDKRAEIVQKSASSLTVVVPAGEPGKTVKVVLETRARVNGVPLSNLEDFVNSTLARFTYEKPTDESKKEGKS